MKRIIILFILLLIILFSLCGCSIYIPVDITEGEIIDKQYIEKKVALVAVPVGKVISPQPKIFPERYQFKIRYDNTTKWIDVTEQEYNEYEIGNYYKISVE